MDELEQEAIRVVKKYKWALMAAMPVKGLLIKISDRLGWRNLKREL
jgi:hypothetical protein